MASPPTLAPIAALELLRTPGTEAVARSLLHLSLLLDAAFNACLGVGLVLLQPGLGRVPGWPRALSWLGIAAGLTSLLPALQGFSDWWANWLALSGPLWLIWVLWAALRAWRGGQSA